MQFRLPKNLVYMCVSHLFYGREFDWLQTHLWIHIYVNRYKFLGLYMQNVYILEDNLFQMVDYIPYVFWPLVISNIKLFCNLVFILKIGICQLIEDTFLPCYKWIFLNKKESLLSFPPPLNLMILNSLLCPCAALKCPWYENVRVCIREI